KKNLSFLSLYQSPSLSTIILHSTFFMALRACTNLLSTLLQLYIYTNSNSTQKVTTDLMVFFQIYVLYIKKTIVQIRTSSKIL
ncbi:hypothetical protein L9F63_003247, partial [Diploptera punctata]